MKNIFFAMLSVLLTSFSLNLMAAAVDFHFENNTDEAVTLGAVFSGKQGPKSRTIMLAAHESKKEVFEGCLQEVRTEPNADLAIKGMEQQTIWKPSKKYGCKSMTTSVHQATNGALELVFVYQ
ncbi:MAG: hypothetical protein AB7F19_04865 [Candidatus Babeliales bacterium]